jgi:hypothetical protein
MGLGWIVGGVIAVAAAAGFALLVHARWLQSRTLEKCVALSVALHGMLAVVCMFVGGTLPVSRGTRDEGRMTMVVVAEPADDDEGERSPPSDEAEVDGESVAVREATAGAAEADGGSAPAGPPADVVPLLEIPAGAIVAVEPGTAAAHEAGGEAAVAAAADGAAATVPSHRVPDAYADRGAGRRATAAAARGGSLETERAVDAALGWLARAQSDDGRWDAARHGAGRGRSGNGQHRPDVGGRSDQGVSGLALLAFLGAGHTQREGLHADRVAGGLRSILSRQRPDGSLAGDAEFFAALYCHGMATLAVAESAAITGDPALRDPLERAVRYTLSVQHPVTGGWRYARGDRGDTSQLGWQVMALSAARQAGIVGLDAAEARARVFLQSVSSGAAGGLASYRPGERPTVAMTAEALACRLFLGLPASAPAAGEALGFMGRFQPDRASPNIYAWYYGTLASFHSGGPQWDAWNSRLQAALLPTQRDDGSWDPDPVWGGHGGRVYATALSALALEVYYRHRPLHRAATQMAAVPP